MTYPTAALNGANSVTHAWGERRFPPTSVRHGTGRWKNEHPTTGSGRGGLPTDSVSHVLRACIGGRVVDPRSGMTHRRAPPLARPFSHSFAPDSPPLFSGAQRRAQWLVHTGPTRALPSHARHGVRCPEAPSSPGDTRTTRRTRASSRAGAPWRTRCAVPSGTLPPVSTSPRSNGSPPASSPST